RGGQAARERADPPRAARRPGGCQAPGAAGRVAPRLSPLPRARPGRCGGARAGHAGPALRGGGWVPASALGARRRPGAAGRRGRPLARRRPPRAGAGDVAHRLAAERAGEAGPGRPRPPFADAMSQDRDRDRRSPAVKALDASGEPGERPALSVVVPVYNEEENVRPLVAAVQDALADTGSWELLLVDDGSTDATVARAEELAERDPRVRVLKLARNYGQTAAMQAGFDHARGVVVV